MSDRSRRRATARPVANASVPGNGQKPRKASDAELDALADHLIVEVLDEMAKDDESVERIMREAVYRAGIRVIRSALFAEGDEPF